MENITMQTNSPTLSDSQIEANRLRKQALDDVKALLEYLNKFRPYLADPNRPTLHIESIWALDACLAPLEPKTFDDRGVDMLASAMKEKLVRKREDGRTGWWTCDGFTLSDMLREHVAKGDPVDVANFCMMLFWHQSQIVTKNAPKYPNEQTPLSVVVRDDKLVIEIGIDTLAYACTNAPKADFEVTNCNGFAIDVRHELLRESEDGTTPVHKMLDKAANDAVEQGSAHTELLSKHKRKG